MVVVTARGAVAPEFGAWRLFLGAGADDPKTRPKFPTKFAN